MPKWPFNRISAKGKRGQARDEPPKEVNAGTQVYRTYTDMSMSNSEAIYAAVSRISNTVASIPVHLFKGYELQGDHQIERLLSFAPNDTMSPFIFFQTLEAYRNVEGRAYALIVPDGRDGYPERLDILDPACVRPIRVRETKDIWYLVSAEDGADFYIHNSSMLALRHMSTNGEIGIRPVDVLKGTLNYDKQVKEISLQQLEGVNRSVVLNIPQTLMDEGKKKSAVNSFLEAYKASAGRVVVLDGGITASTLNQSPIDSKLLDVERITRNRVATVYNIPPHMLGDYSDTSFSTAEQQMQEFLQLTILPIVAQYEQELARKLLTFGRIGKGYRIRFEVESLTRADVAAMAEKYQKAIRGGWMAPDEVRDREGLPPDPSGSGGTLLISKDLVPLHSVVNQPKLTTQQTEVTK